MVADPLSLQLKGIECPRKLPRFGQAASCGLVTVAARSKQCQCCDWYGPKWLHSFIPHSLLVFVIVGGSCPRSTLEEDEPRGHIPYVGGWLSLTGRVERYVALEQ